MAEEEEEEAEEEEVVVVVAAAVDQESVVINQALGLLAAPRPQKELGRGKRKSGHLPVLRSVEELWFILSGLSPPLTVFIVNLLRRFEYGEL